MKLSISGPNPTVRVAPDVSYFTVNDSLFIKRNNGLFKISESSDTTIPLRIFDFLREPKKLNEIINFLPDFRCKDVLNSIRKLCRLDLLKIDETEHEHETFAATNKIDTSNIPLKNTNYVGGGSFANETYYKRLANSEILLIGDGILASKLFSYLNKIGIGSISSSIIDDFHKQSSHLISKFDLIIAAEDYPNFFLFDTLNNLCFEKRRSWLRLSFDDSIGYLGPLVVPGNTSCYNCCRLRLASNSPNYEHQLWRHRECIPKTGLVVSEVFADIICAMGADEIIRYLTNYQKPLTIDSLTALDTRQMHISRHKIVTHPYCIHCNQFVAKKRPKLDRVPRSLITKMGTRKTSGKIANLYISSLSTINDGNNSSSELLFRLRELKDSKTGIILTSKKIFDDNHLGIKAHHFFGAICSSVPRIGLTEDADPANPQDNDPEIIHSNSGSGFSPNEAELRALMESVERYSNIMVNESRFHWAPYNEVKKMAISPVDLILYPHEAHTKPDFRCSQFSPDVTIPWIDGYDVFSGKSILIPADFVYPPIQRKPLVFETSNGAAAHSDKVLAILYGLFEVIERDAFLIMWLNKLSMPILDIKSLPFGFKESIKSINDFGMQIKLIDLTNDTHVPTIMAACYNESAEKYPALVIGIGTHIEPEKALQKALFEMEISVLDVLNKPMEKKISIEQISKPYDHKVFYLNPKMRKYWDFMLNSRKKKYVLPKGIGASFKNNSSYSLLRRVVRQLHTMNYRVLFSDITPTDMKGLGLSAVKVLIPGFQPLYFGNNIRLSTRLNTVPIILGYNSRITDDFELNLEPHPLP